MSPASTTLPLAAESARDRADRAEAIKRAWQGGQAPDAAAALRANPDIAADRPVALDLAYEEFCTREEGGEVLDADAFCARFPFAASLRRLLAVHQFLDEHPDALGAAPPSWPAAGDPVGDFVALRELGRGSFARVYLALETTAGGRPVVLKVSAASREADTLGPLAHPHLIPVLSGRTVGAWTVVAMPFVGTATLEDVIEAVWPRGRTAPPVSGAVLRDAAARGGRPEDPPFPGRPAPLWGVRTRYADAVGAVAAGLFGAVAYLHEQGVVHRDIKPSNVLLGPGGHPYLLDFNLASCSADPWRLVGTLPYMAPEQLARFAAPPVGPNGPSGGAPDGRPGDVFACGVVLFELLTGRHPFGARGAGAASLGPRREEVAAALLAAQRAGHPKLAALNPTVRRAVRDAVERCLAYEPARRPTAAELVALFAPPREQRWPARAAALAGAGAVALALGYAGFRAPAPTADGPVAPPPAGPAAPTVAPVPDGPFERGLFLSRKGAYGLAAVEFLEAGSTGRDGRAYEHAAFCLSHGRDPQGAIKAADDAILLGHRPGAVYANRAYNHFKQGNYQEAKADCDVALGLVPDLVPARYTRACVHLQLHLRARAQPNAGALPSEAVEDIDRVTGALTGDPEVWTTAAHIYVFASDGRPELLDRAARAVREAVRAGKDPKKIAQSFTFAPLADHPVYKAALRLPPGAPSPSAHPHIANPSQ